MHQRIIAPEILETLDPEDPVAIKGRRDLVWINFAMGNHRWLQRQLKKYLAPESRLLELGAGDGVFGEKLVKNGICSASLLHGMDLVPSPPFWPQGASWTQGDILAGSALPECDIIFSSLFLHHLQDDQIRELGRRIPRSCRMILAVEPARRARHFWQARFFHFAARLHPITKHDMLTSIRGGFCGSELQTLLQLDESWRCEVKYSWRGGYCFKAQKNAV